MDTRNVLALTSLGAETRAALTDEGSSAGCELEFVENLPAAMRVLSGRRPPTAVLVDLALEDGVKLCQSVRSKRRSVDVAIFAVSQATDDRSFARALVLGADDVIDPRCNGALASRLVALPLDPSIPSVARGDALVATREAALAHLVGRVLTNAGYDVEYAHDFLALRQGSSRERMKLVVTTLDFGDLRSHVAKARDAGSAAVWVVLAAPSDLPRVESNLDGIPGTGVVSRGNPLDDILYVSNELRAGARGTEARIEQRVPFGTVVAFRPQSTTTWEHGFSWNVSATGLYVRTLAPPLDAAVVLRVAAPGMGRMVTLEGELAWQRGFGRLSAATAPPGFGVHVVSGDAEDVQIWKDACQGLTRARRGSGAFRLDTAAALAGATPASNGEPSPAADGAKREPADVKLAPRATPARGQTLPFGARVETLPEHTATTVRAPPNLVAEVLGITPGSQLPQGAPAEENAPTAEAHGAAGPKLDKTLLIASSGTKHDAPPPPRRSSANAFAATLPAEGALSPHIPRVVTPVGTPVIRGLPEASVSGTTPAVSTTLPGLSPQPAAPPRAEGPLAPTLLGATIPTAPAALPAPATPAQVTSALQPVLPELSSPQPPSVPEQTALAPSAPLGAAPAAPLRAPPVQAEVAPWPTPGPGERSGAAPDAYPIPRPIPSIADSPRAPLPQRRSPGLLVAAVVVLGVLVLGSAGLVLVFLHLSSTARPAPEPARPPPGRSVPTPVTVPAARAEPSRPSAPARVPTSDVTPPTSAPPSAPEVAPPSAPVPAATPSPPSAPTSTVPRSTAPEVTSDSASAALLSYEGHLQVDSGVSTNVYAMGVLVGRTNERLKVRCGLRFIRLGTAPGHWQSPGYTVEVGCQRFTRLRIEPTS